MPSLRLMLFTQGTHYLYIGFLPNPAEEKGKYFYMCQWGRRNNVECAFGVFRKKLHITYNPRRFWFKEVMYNIMNICIIIHNMDVEKRKSLLKRP